MRYSELLSTIEGISQKVLSQRLSKLTSYGMLTRTSYPETPPRVVYGLTGVGKSAVTPAKQMVSWVTVNIDKVIAAKNAMQA